MMDDHIEAVLVVERGVADFSVVPIEHSNCVLGKSAGASIILDNPYVSRRHARIRQRSGEFEIEDLGSKNGTLLNGSRIRSGRHPLQPGDRIELGRGQVVLRFQMGGSTVTLPPDHKPDVEDLVVNSRSREVWVRGRRLDPPLSRKEFDILSLMFSNRGQACSKDDIAIHGWPERPDGDVPDQDIEQYIRRLRLRVELNPSRPTLIVNVRGFGYRLSSRR